MNTWTQTPPAQNDTNGTPRKKELVLLSLLIRWFLGNRRQMSILFSIAPPPPLPWRCMMIMEEGRGRGRCYYRRESLKYGRRFREVLGFFGTVLQMCSVMTELVRNMRNIPIQFLGGIREVFCLTKTLSVPLVQTPFCRLLLAKQTWLGQDSGGVICIIRHFYWTDRAFPIFSPTLLSRSRSSNYRPEFLLAINTASASAAFFSWLQKGVKLSPAQPSKNGHRGGSCGKLEKAKGPKIKKICVGNCISSGPLGKGGKCHPKRVFLFRKSFAV